MSDRRPTSGNHIAGQILLIARRDGLEPGVRLVEQHLADRIGVSRGPVRAGLKTLADAGIVISARNRGYVLAKDPTSRAAEAVLSVTTEDDDVYRRIADDRLQGRLADVVSEAELARCYDVSRASLVRLLDRIAGEGWVEKLPGYGWRFAQTLSTTEAYAKSVAFRAAIEPAALQEPDYALPADVIDRLAAQQRQIHDHGLDTLTMGEVFRSGCDFHEEIIRGTDNPFYLEALRRVNAIRRLFAYRMYADRDGMRRHIRDHLRLLDLLARDRRSDAAALMRRHLLRKPGSL